MDLKVIKKCIDFISFSNNIIYITASVAKDYNLVETWMLSLRYKEAILQNRKEMEMYVKSLKRIRTLLEEDIKTVTGA